MNSSNKYSSTASTLVEFLPVMDRLVELRNLYGEDEFGKLYNALPGAFHTAFKELGVTEYSIQEGEPVDRMRMTVVEEQHSETPADTVLQVLSDGMELQGNVIRGAACVISKGTEEKVAAEEAPADETPNIEPDME